MVDVLSAVTGHGWAVSWSWPSILVRYPTRPVVEELQQPPGKFLGVGWHIQLADRPVLVTCRRKHGVQGSRLISGDRVSTQVFKRVYLELDSRCLEVTFEQQLHDVGFIEWLVQPVTAQA